MVESNSRLWPISEKEVVRDFQQILGRRGYQQCDLKSFPLGIKLPVNTLKLRHIPVVLVALRRKTKITNRYVSMSTVTMAQSGLLYSNLGTFSGGHKVDGC